MGTPMDDKKAALNHVHEIEAAEKGIQAQIENVQRQLKWLDQNHTPDSHPWITFKTIQSIEQLRNPQPSMRIALQQDLSQLREARRLLDLELESARQKSKLANLKAKKYAADQSVKVHAQNFSSKLTEALVKGKAAGEWPKEEIEGILGDGEKVMDEQISLLKKDPSDKNIQNMVDTMKTLAVLGGDIARGMDAWKSAGIDRIGLSVRKVMTSATKESMKELAERTRDLMFLEDSEDTRGVTDYARKLYFKKLVEKKDKALRQFRSVPTLSNYSEYRKNCRELEKWEPDWEEGLPQGFHDAPRGTTHIVKVGETLSQISARYYGKPGYWDVILLRNLEALENIKNLNHLPHGLKLVIA
jgi:nucleoid-associated protein YgaU